MSKARQTAAVAMVQPARAARVPPAFDARIRPGEPFPLGATWDGKGTNFSIFSEVATRVELCLFDQRGNETHYDLPERTALY